MEVLLHKWEFKNIEVEFLKVSEKIWSQDFQILVLGSPGTSWFWQLVQALSANKDFENSRPKAIFASTLQESHKAIFAKYILHSKEQSQVVLSPVFPHLGLTLKAPITTIVVCFVFCWLL